MKPGQLLTRWWQDYVAGRLRTPQAVYRAAVQETPLPSLRIFETPEDGPVWDAPLRLQAPGFFNCESYLRQSTRADWAYCDRRLMYWAALFVQNARKRGIPLYVHCALRDEAEQAKLKAQGHSKAVYPRSAHNIGEAVDIVHSVFHWNMTRDEWALLHVLGRLTLDRVNAQLPKPRKLSLTWGGDFKSLYDPAHWEISDYRARVRRLPPAPPVTHTPTAILAGGQL